MKRRLRQILSLLVFACAPLGYAAVQPLLTGDKNEYDFNTDVSTLRGNACFIAGDMTLHADEIRYFGKEGKASARGNVVLSSGEFRLLAEQIDYSLNDGTYTVQKPRLGDFPLYLKGVRAEGTRESVSIFDADVSYFDPDPLTPSLHSRKVTYSMKKRGAFSAEYPSMGIGSFKPFTLPKIDEKLALVFRSYVTLAGGYRGSLGPFLEPGIRLPVASGLKLGGDLGLYTKRGIMVGPAGAYSAGKTDDETFTRSSLRSGYIRDHGNRYLDVLGDPVPADRGYVTWEHRQRIAPGFDLDAKVNTWSDSEVLRDFRPREFFPVQVPDNFVESVYSGDNYVVSLFTRFQPNNYHDSQERLPELRFDLMPVPLFGGIYQRFNSSYVWLREKDPVTGVKLASDRADAYYGLTRNFSATPWLGATGVLGGRVTRYANTRGATVDGTYTRRLGEIGFDAHLNASGTYDYKNERWGIDGLRHLVTPQISYRYIPKGADGKRFIPSIDRESFNTYLPQLGLNNVRSIDALDNTNTLRIGVENTLQTRDGNYGSRDLASFVIANDFRYMRTAGQNQASDTHLGLALTPVRWMRFDLYQSIDPHNFELRELNTGFSINDGNLWTLKLSTHYLRHDIAEYVADYNYRINEAYTALLRLHYDSRRSRMNEQTYGIRQVLNRTWTIRYLASILQGPRREDSFGFSVEVETFGF